MNAGPIEKNKEIVMKAVLSLIILCPMLLQAANDISLIVKPGQPGRINDHTIDVTQLPAGSPITVQVKLSNFDFTLAGAEFVLKFPSHDDIGGPYRMRATDADFQGANPPVVAHSDWGTPNLMVLPIDQNGNRKASQVSNDYGVLRFGAMFLDSADRLVGNGATDIIVAEFEFYLGNQTLASCITSQTEIWMYTCSGPGRLCTYFSDENGNAITTNSTGTANRVTLINNNAAHPKGDVNKDGNLSTADVISLINCANQISCDLNPDELIQIGDFNCDGNMDTLDIFPLMDHINQQTGTFKTAQTSRAVSRNGMLAIDFAGAVGSAAQFDIDFLNEPFTRADLHFADPAAAEDWALYARHNPFTGKMPVIMVSRNQEETAFPELRLSFDGSKASHLVDLLGARLFDTDRNAFYLPATLKQVQSTANSETRGPELAPTHHDRRGGK